MTKDGAGSPGGGIVMEMCNARIAKMRRKMGDEDLDLLIFYSNGRHSFLEANAVRWASGYKSMGPHSAVVLPKDDDPTLILVPVWDEARARKRSPIRRVLATNSFEAAFTRVVHDQKLAGSKVGVVGYNVMAHSTVDFISSQLRTTITPFDSQFDSVAMIRDELELGLYQRATRIAELAYEHMLQSVRPGMFEYELAAEMDRYTKSIGADDNFQLMSANQHNLAVRAPGDRRLDVGDIILAEISPSVQGQFAQICRTVVLGPVNDCLKEKYQLLIDSMEAGMKTGSAGATVREVVEVVNNVMIRAGYEKFCFPPYMRVRGHGCGTGSILPGDLMLENEMSLRAGMTFVIHPNQYIPETGYLLCGEPVVVTQEGMRALSRRKPGIDSIAV